MTKEQFINIQDNILKLKGTELSDLIGAERSSISGYRNGTRVIPDYIANAMETQAGLALQSMQFPISLADLIQLSRNAEKARCTVEAYVTRLLRTDLTAARETPAKPRPLYTPEIASSRLNEDPADPDAPRKQPA